MLEATDIIETLQKRHEGHRRRSAKTRTPPAATGGGCHCVWEDKQGKELLTEHQSACWNNWPSYICQGGPSADKPREDHHYKALRGRTSGNRRAKAFTSEGGPLPRWGPAATGGATKEDNSCHQPLSPDTIIMTQISEIMHETKTNK